MSNVSTEPEEDSHGMDPVTSVELQLPPNLPPGAPDKPAEILSAIPIVSPPSRADAPVPTYDAHATVAGLVTGICGILAYFHIVVPSPIAAIAGSLGLMAMGYFTNKARKR